MMAFKHAAEKGMFIKRPNGMSYGILSPYKQHKEALLMLNYKEAECRNRLFNSEEFLRLPKELKDEARDSLSFFFNGARNHARLFAVTKGSDRVAATFALDRKSTRLNSSHVRISYA